MNATTTSLWRMGALELTEAIRSREGRVPGNLAADRRPVSIADGLPQVAQVIAVLPPSPDRPYLTELLLCGHHYRLSRRTLAAAGATVLDPDGAPVPPQDIWVSQQARSARRRKAKQRVLAGLPGRRCGPSA